MEPKVENLTDRDPISLEPVQSLTCYFDYVHKGKIYRYDAWAWLEMLVHEETDKYTHPLFRSPLTIQTRQECFDACRRTPPQNRRTDLQQRLIDVCLSQTVHKQKVYDADKRLCSIHIFTVSPLFEMCILDWWWKWSDGSNAKPVFAKAMNCQAALDVSILDSNGQEAFHRQYFV